MDGLGQLDRFGHVFGGLHETAELNRALEGFDVDFGRADGGVVEDRGLHLGGDGGVVQVLAGAFLGGCGRAAHKTKDDGGAQQNGGDAGLNIRHGELSWRG